MPLSFKQAGSLFVAGPNINIYPSGNTFAISGSASGGGGTIISGTNVGTAVAVFSGVVGTNMLFRTIRAGANAGVFLSGNDIVFSATTGSINGVTAVTNLGTGIAVASAVTAGALISRTISGANGIEAVESGNLVIVRPFNLTANRFVIAGTGGALTTSDFFQLDSTVGTAAIGFNAPESNTTSRLLIAAGTGVISQLRFTPFSARYSSATAGDITYNSTSGNSLLFNKTTTLQTPFIFKDNNYSLTSATIGNRLVEVDTSGTLNSTRFFNTLGVFNVITSTTISGTSELSTINTNNSFIIGSTLLNSSSHGTNPQLLTGKKYRFNAKGYINSDVSPGNLTSKLKLGSVIIASAITALQTNINGDFFEIDCTFTIRNTGASGNVIGSGKMLTDAALLSTASPIAPITSLGQVTIDTTTDKIFDLTLQFSDLGNEILINEATLEYLN